VRLAAGLVLWLGFLKLPHVPPQPQVDISQQALYAYLTATGARFGRDFCDIVGPLGFIVYGYVYAGYFFWLVVAGQAVLEGLLAALVVALGRTMRERWMEGVFYALAFFCFAFYDLNHEWLILLGALWLLRKPGARTEWLIGYAVLCGFFALTKHTFCVLGMLGLGAVLMRLAFAGQWQRAVMLPAAFGCSVVAWWLAAGQRAGDLAGYFYSSMQVSKGYEALALYEPLTTTLLGLAAFFTVAGTLGWLAVRHRRNPGALMALALLGIELLLRWKHGFTRADIHTDVFFTNVPILMMVALAEAERWQSAPGARRTRWVQMGATAAALLLMWAGLGQYSHVSLAVRGGNVVQQLLFNADCLRDLPRYRATAEAVLEHARVQYALPPEILGRVRGEPVDVWGCEQGVAILNGLHLRCRPMPATLTSYNAFLLEANRRFLAGEDKNAPPPPRFMLFKVQPFDQRLPALEDSLAFREVINRYRPVASESGWLLLERGAERLEQSKATTTTGTFRFGEGVALPAAPPGCVRFIRLKITATLAGRLLGAAYKMPRLRLAVHSGASKMGFRLIRENAGAGFLIDPIVLDLPDFEILLTDGERVHPQIFTVFADKGPEWAYEGEIGYAVETVPLRHLGGE
jgi:hypothetical protein